MKINVLKQYQEMKREINFVSQKISELTYASDQSEGLEKLKQKYEQLLEQLRSKQLEIEELAESLEPVERNLIRYRYFNGWKWEAVFRKLNYSQKQTFRIHSRIINKLNNLER